MIPGNVRGDAAVMRESCQRSRRDASTPDSDKRATTFGDASSTDDGHQAVVIGDNADSERGESSERATGDNLSV